MKPVRIFLLAVSIALLAIFVFVRSNDPSSAVDLSVSREIPGADSQVQPDSADRTPQIGEVGTSKRTAAADDLAGAGVQMPSHLPTAAEIEAEHEAAELNSLLESLRGGKLDASGQSKAWRRLEELGLADKLIEQLMAELEASPSNADLHAMLGNALVTKMRAGDLSPAERGKTSTAAMASFDKALELDPQNWTARFSRAMSNSSAPAFLGRQGAAIQDFETLLSQQKFMPLSDDQAHTYFFLANMHAAGGNAARATELRTEAHGLFPNDPRFAPGAH